jgi:hypothetical protein
VAFRFSLGTLALSVACASTGGGVGGTAGDASTGGTNTGGMAGSTTGGGTGGIFVDAGDGSFGKQLVYAHTDTTLFSVDPSVTPLKLTQLGDFDCIGDTGEDVSMTDVAVDSQGNLFGISATKVQPLNVVGTVVECGTPVVLSGAADPKFYALTFVPAGILDPNDEVLVAGNTAGELWSVASTGNLTLLGTFGVVPANDGNGHTYPNSGKAWELSGDVVFLANDGNPLGYATVRDCPNPPSASSCSGDDTLIEIDVPKLATASGGSVTKSVRGLVVKRAGCSDSVVGSYDNMFGIAAWGDRVYGFSRAGYLVDIDIADGSACLVDEYPGAKFSGAGITTLAPVIAPPPK